MMPVVKLGPTISLPREVLEEARQMREDMRRAMLKAWCEHQWSLDSGCCIHCGTQL